MVSGRVGPGPAPRRFRQPMTKGVPYLSFLEGVDAKGIDSQKGPEISRLQIGWSSLVRSAA